MAFDLPKAIEILERTPLTLKALLAGLSEEWTHTNEGGESWSPFDVIGHLIHGEKTDWVPRLQIILEDRGEKTFEPFDRFAQFTDNQGKSLEELLGIFESLRAFNINALLNAAITQKDLEKQGIHPDFGPVRLSELLATWVVHDLNHIAQISRVMARQYQDEVGPWKQYLSVLK